MSDNGAWERFQRLTASEQLFYLAAQGALTAEAIAAFKQRVKAEKEMASAAGIAVPSYAETLREFQAAFADVDEDEVFALLATRGKRKTASHDGGSSKSRRASASTPTA